MPGHIKNAVKALLAAGHQGTSILDRRYMRGDAPLRWPPVFIIGTPRSGTTLFYQMMVRSLNVAYFPNLSNTFYKCPVTAARLARALRPVYTPSYNSRYGFEHGWGSPSESGNIWNRWFPRQKEEGFNYTPAGYLSKTNQQEIRRIIKGIEDVHGYPFLTKNGKSGLRIPALLEIFPDAIFLHIRRRLADSAISILVRRRTHHESWWSVYPKEINEFINDDEITQVAKQVYYIENNILNDLNIFVPERAYSITYEQLCLAPRTHAGKIYKFLRDYGCETSFDRERVPESFPESNKRDHAMISDDEIHAIEVKLELLSQAGSTTERNA